MSVRDPSPNPSAESRQLADAVRAAAASIAHQLGGGIALVFATAPDGDDATPRLRAAAGFESAEAAREAAMAVVPEVREALEAGGIGAYSAHPALGARAQAGTIIHPLVWGDRTHGALVTGSPAPLDAAGTQGLSQAAELLSLRFDHAHLASRSDSVAEEPELAEDKSEEMLKLSEALFAQDIELLRSNEKLGKIEKLKSDFIERMSRELRTPLNSIIEAIIAVLTGEDDSLSESAKSTLRSALDDGTGFLRTLQNILDLWRIKQGELPVEAQIVNFQETVDEAIFSVQDGVGDRPIAIEQNLAEGLQKMRTDLAKINQILFLLLDNAVKFTHRGQIDISASVEDDQLRCSVSDTGIGICPDDQQYMFDEFFQVDDVTSQRYRGAGLGLTLVRDLVVLLGGDVEVQSEVGIGTTVSFSVPIQPAT